MRYYIATSLSRAPIHNLVRDELCLLGHEITYDWTVHGSVQTTSKERLKEVAHLELNAIDLAEVVLVLLPGGKGTHTELGYSIARQKKVLIHSETSFPFELGPEVCAFYYHKEVTRFSCPIPLIANRFHALILNNPLVEVGF